MEPEQEHVEEPAAPFESPKLSPTKRHWEQRASLFEGVQINFELDLPNEEHQVEQIVEEIRKSLEPVEPELKGEVEEQEPQIAECPIQELQEQPIETVEAQEVANDEAGVIQVAQE